jgi:hypothetical protein
LDHYAGVDVKGERCLLPINYATVIGGHVGEEGEVLGTGEFGGRMVWQSGRKNTRKPTPDRLNYDQFYEASARILREIKLTPTEEDEYLDYMRQLGVLLQTFSCASVFTLDHLHRLRIHQYGGRWNIIENSMENATLKKKDENVSRNSVPVKSGRPSSGRDSKGKVIPADATCWMYNLHKGCTYGDTCYYPHVCIVDGCRKNIQPISMGLYHREWNPSRVPDDSYVSRSDMTKNIKVWERELV